MIKGIMSANETVLPNSKEMAVLRENFPSCFRADGSFDIVRFKEYINDKVAVSGEGYELKFLGKNYARLLASMDTTTVIVPDEEHNSRPENASSQNIYISGDNLDGLKQLLKSYTGDKRIKCIYIDPPYNTGTDGFVYNDKFHFTVDELSAKLSIDEGQAKRILDLTKRGSASHSAWLMFMYSRLLLARDLLADEGAIFISIDDNEQANMKLVCDDIFGENNFMGLMTLQSNPRGSQNTTGLSYVHEYVMMYAKNSDLVKIAGISKDNGNLSEYSLEDSKGRYRLLGLRKRGGAWRREDRPLMYYPIYVNPDNGACSLEKDDNYTVKVIPKRPTGELSRWTWGQEKFQKERELLVGKRVNRSDEDDAWDIFRKDYLLSDDGKVKTTRLKTIWTEKETNYQNAKNEMKELFGDSELFDYPKPTYIMSRLIGIISDEDDDVILDFFSGSGSTAHAVMRTCVEDMIHRNFIAIQLKEQVRKGSQADKAGYHTIDEIGMERIRRAAAKLRKQHPDTTADLGFKHFTLQEPSEDTLDKLEKFVPEDQGMFVANNIFQDFGEQTVLSTWLVRDGYGFNGAVQALDFAGYTGYYMEKHLYLIDADITDEAIMAIEEKYETDGSFNPENVVLFGYNFVWTKTEALKTNLARLKDTEKNLRINFDVRY